MTPKALQASKMAGFPSQLRLSRCHFAFSAAYRRHSGTNSRRKGPAAPRKLEFVTDPACAQPARAPRPFPVLRGHPRRRFYSGEWPPVARGGGRVAAAGGGGGRVAAAGGGGGGPAVVQRPQRAAAGHGELVCRRGRPRLCSASRAEYSRVAKSPDL